MVMRTVKYMQDIYLGEGNCKDYDRFLKKF